MNPICCYTSNFQKAFFWLFQSPEPFWIKSTLVGKHRKLVPRRTLRCGSRMPPCPHCGTIYVITEWKSLFHFRLNFSTKDHCPKKHTLNMTEEGWGPQRQSPVPCLGMILVIYYSGGEPWTTFIKKNFSNFSLKSINVISSPNTKEMTRPRMSYNLLSLITWELSSFYLDFQAYVQWRISFFCFFLHIHTHFNPEYSFTILLTIFFYLPLLFPKAFQNFTHSTNPSSNLRQIFSLLFSLTLRWFPLPYKPNVKAVNQF